MSDQARNDAKIAGEGTLSGGSYGAITINGAGAINGDVDCATLRINGAGTANGRVKAESVTINGAGTINGEMQAAELNVNGDGSIRDGAGIGRLSIKGRCSVGGGLAAHDIDLKGELKVSGDCEAESVIGEGALVVGGLLNAGTIDMRVYAPCSAREIGGEKITVRQPGTGFQSFTQLFTFWADKRLTAETIEGDDVFLELTFAKTVRGRNVTIGDGCQIDLVEYSDNYSRVDGATVGEARKVVAES